MVQHPTTPPAAWPPSITVGCRVQLRYGRGDVPHGMVASVREIPQDGTHTAVVVFDYAPGGRVRRVPLHELCVAPIGW